MACSVIYAPQLLEIIRYIILTTVIIFCDSFVLYIWLKPSNRSAITVCLAILAVSDISSMLFGTVNTLTERFSVIWKDVSVCVIYILSQTLSDMFHSLSIFITMSIALQRFVVCAFPFRGPAFCHSKARAILLSICFAIPLFFTAPFIYELSDMRTLELNSKHNHDSVETDNLTAMRQNEFDQCPEFYTRPSNEDVNDVMIDNNTCSSNCTGDNDGTFKDYQTMACISPRAMSETKLRIYNIIFLVVQKVLPLLIILFCMGYCIFTINKKTVHKSTNSKNGANYTCRRKKTNLLVLVMMSASFGEVPNTTAVILEMIFGKSRADIWLLSPDGSTFCKLCSSTSYLHNVIIYTAMSKPFRQTFLGLFSCKQRRRRGNHVSI